MSVPQHVPCVVKCSDAELLCLLALVSEECSLESKPKVLFLSRLLYCQTEGGIKELIIFKLLHLTI